MLEYFNYYDKSVWNKNDVRTYLKDNINDICFVETLIKYFEGKYKKHKNKVEVKCNLKYLINDLDYLKQYLDS